MSAIPGVLTVAGLGVVFAGTSGARLVRARRLRGRGVEAEAVVVAQQEMPVSGGQLQRPVLVFTTREGRTVQVSSPVGRTDADLLPGHTVTIHYDPADPRTVSIPEHELGTYWLMLAIGLFLLALLAAYAVLGERVFDGIVGIPAFVGAVFTGIGWFGIGRTRRLRHGVRTDGVVIGAITTENRDGITLYHPVVRFRTPRGDTIDAPAIRGHASRPPPPGTPVRVCHDRANPQRMTLASDHAPAVFWIFGTLGPLLTVAGLVIVVASLR